MVQLAPQCTHLLSRNSVSEHAAITADPESIGITYIRYKTFTINQCRTCYLQTTNIYGTVHYVNKEHKSHFNRKKTNLHTLHNSLLSAFFTDNCNYILIIIIIKIRSFVVFYWNFTNFILHCTPLHTLANSLYKHLYSTY